MGWREKLHPGHRGCFQLGERELGEDSGVGFGCQSSEVREKSKTLRWEATALETSPPHHRCPHLASEPDSPHLTHFSFKSPKPLTLPIPFSLSLSPCNLSVLKSSLSVSPVCLRSGSPVLLSHGPISVTKGCTENGPGFHI